MDKIPGPGGGAGPGVDGAFERFLTAAIATIITIMFSWRLLAEEEEAAARGEGIAPNPSRPPARYAHLGPAYAPGRFDPMKTKLPSPTGSSIGINDIDISDSEESGVGLNSPDSDIAENIISEKFESQTSVGLNSALPAGQIAQNGSPTMSDDDGDMGDTGATLTTWDQYKWEEELGQEERHVIKTRRSVRDFAKSPGALNLQPPPKPAQDRSNPDLDSIDAVANANSGDQTDSAKSPVVPFTQRFANFEYKDTGGDSGYVDLYPDSDTSESSDDENVYEIQVSDSDSDSPDERSGSFFGVTALDTIMEEFESESEEESDSDDEGSGVEMGSYDARAGKIVDLGFRDEMFENENGGSNSNFENRDSEYNDSEYVERPEINEEMVTELQVDQKLNSAYIGGDNVNMRLTPQQNVAVLESSDAEITDDDLSLERSCNVETVLSTHGAGSDDLQKCDLSVNNTPAMNENTAVSQQNDKCKVTSSELNYSLPQNVSDLANGAEPVGTVPPKSHQADPASISLHLPLVKDIDNDYNVSELSDDSLPSSPVRTCALDNLAGDNFSDTESCSSESVITVLSVRSNDSDSYTTGERYDVTCNLPSGKLGHRQKVAAGRSDQSANINDLTNDGSGLYENNSLVSGFLNDSLNSLLSANNGETDTESEGEYEREQTSNLDPDQNNDTLNKVDDNNVSPENRESELIDRDLDEGCEESIVAEESIRPEASRLQSNESVSIPAEISQPRFPDNETCPTDQLDGGIMGREIQDAINQDAALNEYHYSDNSSDSSDPPLREYDPDDDDLAAFQFNQDCDNDSFYLLVGNEGSLRNFDTFTNLNSLELSPEYGDAVASSAIEEDARGFKFSYTEEINTDFKKRSYFTDRNISSDSDARSDEPLSPITSEDEEMVASENDKNEKFLNPDSEMKLDSASAYDDAELSAPVIDTSDVNNPQNTAKRSIDFLKYIIHPDSGNECDSPGDQDRIRSQNSNKVASAVDQDSGTNACEIIDPTGVITDRLAVSDINNKPGESEQPETLSSLTEKIQSLAHVSDSDSSENGNRLLQNKDKSDSESDKAVDSDISSESEQAANTNSRDAAKSKHRETNIDDIFVEETQVTVTNNNATPQRESVKIETNIDDIFEQEADVKTEYTPPVSNTRATPSRSKIETNIDDIFDDNISNASSDTSSSSKKVTNIDEIFDEPKTKASPRSRQSAKIETNIDDIFNTIESESKPTAPTHSRKTETNIDDIIDSSPVHDTSLSYESFVDDLLQPVSSSQTQSVPTSESAIDRDRAPHSATDRGEAPPSVTDRGEVPASSDLVVETAVVAESQFVTRSRQIRSEDHIKPRQYTSGKPEYEQTDVHTGDNRQLKDSPSDSGDKISNTSTPRAEHSLDLNIEPQNNERECKSTDDKDTVLQTNKESQLKRDTSRHTPDTVTKLPQFNNDTNNNSELGLNPDINNAYNVRADRGQLSTTLSGNLPGGKLPDNVVDIDAHSPAVAACGIELRITEDDAASQKSDVEYHSDVSDNLSSAGSSSFVSDDETYHSVDDNLLYQYSKLRDRGLSESSISRVVRSPLTKPSELFGKSKDLGQGVKRRIVKQRLKKYTSILQQPITPERSQSPVSADSPERPPSATRLKVLQSRQRFLSAENLSGGSFEDKFLQHRTSLVTSTPRKYLKRHERSRTELQSTESLPTDMSHMYLLNASYDSYTGSEKMHSLPSPRNIEELYASRNSSANSSFERPDHHRLHANCIFSPEKRAEISHTTQSLENMFEQLLRYGSVSSLAAETDLDAADVAPQNMTLPNDVTDAHLAHYVSFQYSPLERAASMSAIQGTGDGHRLPRKPNKGRFAKKNMPKSKSLQTLETNLDDVFGEESELAGGPLKKAPSVHELRVSKSLSKLNVPSWFSKSGFSRSDSTQSLFTYAGRLGSTSTLGSCAYPSSIASSPAPTPGSGTVIIQKRVTPSPTSPASAKLLRAPALPTTPEKSPIHPTALPSDKFRKKSEQKKDLKPIPIIPFNKLRAMFESGDKKGLQQMQQQTRSGQPISPTKDKPKVTFEKISPTKELHTNTSPTRRETAIDDSVFITEPVPKGIMSKSPPPNVPERKPILSDPARRSESTPQANAQPRRTQVHFSDEPNVSKSQEQKSNVVQQNGTSSKPKSTVNKKGLRASLPLPQFRFRRPGIFATKADPPAPAPAPKSSGPSQPETPQSKKGKVNGYHGNQHYRDIDYPACHRCAHMSCPPWLHALELNAKTDGETLFEFLQKRRYSSILENGFAEQLDDLHERDLSHVTLSSSGLVPAQHSTGRAPLDGVPDLRVVLTDACSHRAHSDFLNNKLRGDASVDEILDGLLLLDGYRTGRMRMDENGRIVPKLSGDVVYSPDTPPGLALSHNTPMCNNNYDLLCVDADTDTDADMHVDYVLVKCEFPPCHRETNLREARKCYKTCHSCATYYCSRTCRKNDWDAHKKLCVYSRINSACKHVIKCINRVPQLQYQCSRVARRGYLAQGRGCVVFAFPDIGSADDFLFYGMESLWVPPVYVALKDLANATMLGSKLEILSDTCKQYNPELKYVIHVAIVIPPQLPVRPVPRRMDGIIQKCAKLRLSPAHMHPKQQENPDNNHPSTLILTAVPGNQHSDEQDGRKTRELSFINIQRKLRHRGISLRHAFPEVYNKLIDFVADAKHFSPLIIYPTDERSGRKFMCVIMPEAEPEIEWISDPDVFHALGVFEEFEEFEEEAPSTPNLSLLCDSDVVQPEVML